MTWNDYLYERLNNLGLSNRDKPNIPFLPLLILNKMNQLMKYKITMEIIRAYKDPQIPLVNLHESTSNMLHYKFKRLDEIYYL